MVSVGGSRLALSTDTYVVRPWFFPGGNIGDLAVNGTVNDLAMCGAVPLFLTVGFILEEGLPMDELGRVVDTMAAAARAAGVEIVTGDTKVVDSGHGDGLYVTTAGVGLVPDGVRVGPDQARPGDVVLVSGPIGLHGIAVMSVREGLEFGSDIRSDTAPLNGVVADAARPRASRCTRCATRPAAGLRRRCTRSPARPAWGSRSASATCRCRTTCAPPAASWVSTRSTSPTRAGWSRSSTPPTPIGRWRSCGPTRSRPGAVAIGTVVAEHPGIVVARTPIGGTRVVDLPLAEQLPRIC